MLSDKKEARQLIDKETGLVLKQDSILEFAEGGIMERADEEFKKVIANIADPNTEAKAKRKITIELTFQPSNDRKYISADIAVKSKLAPYANLGTSMRMSKAADLFSIAEETSQLAGQFDMCGNEQAPGKVIQFRDK